MRMRSFRALDSLFRTLSLSRSEMSPLLCTLTYKKISSLFVPSSFILLKVDFNLLVARRLTKREEKKKVN